MNAIVPLNKFDESLLTINDETGAIHYLNGRCLVSVNRIILYEGCGHEPVMSVVNIHELSIRNQDIGGILSRIFQLYNDEGEKPIEIQEDIDEEIFLDLMKTVPNFYSGWFVYEFVQIVEEEEKVVLKIELVSIDNVRILVDWDEFNADKLSVSEEIHSGSRKILYDGYKFLIRGKPDTVSRNGIDCVKLTHSTKTGEACGFEIDEVIVKIIKAIDVKVRELFPSFNFTETKTEPTFYTRAELSDLPKAHGFKGTPRWLVYDFHESPLISKVRYFLYDVRDITLF